MTMILRETNADMHKTTEISPVFAIDRSRSRCLQYDQIRGSDVDAPHSLLLDEDVLLQSGAEEIQIRHDLLDCGIDICTPEVLALWSDNFDYEAPRRGFLHSVLKDYELNGKTMHVFIEKQGYGNRVRDMQDYDRISQDILSRRTFPFCPDGAFGEPYGCRMYKGNLFKEDGVSLAKKSRAGRRTVIGKGTTIGARSVIEGSVIGRNCVISEDCVVKGAFIWDNVVVGAGTHIQKALIANDVVIGKESRIQQGTLLSFGTVLPDKSVTRDGQRIRQSKGGVPTGDALASGEGESDDDDGSIGLISRGRSRSGSTSSISTLTSSRSASPDPIPHHRSLSMASAASDGSTPGAPSLEASFHGEAVASIYDSLLRGDDPANINLELQAQRLALNASEHAVRKAVVSALVSFILHVREEQRGKGASVHDILKRNGDLIRRVVFDDDLEDKTDQVDLLLLMQRELVSKKEAEAVMLSLCNGLYAEDLVQGEALVQWWDDDKGTESESMAAVRSHKQMSQLIDIAREEDDSEEEEDDDDEEESSDDE